MLINNLLLSSPRLWGCFQGELFVHQLHQVFPTPVGVFLVTGSVLSLCICLPHACGGVSISLNSVSLSSVSSPRLWGCFYGNIVYATPVDVFPTPVGVFLTSCRSSTEKERLPHACGGVSAKNNVVVTGRGSSPRLWGCFRMATDTKGQTIVFPTPVGVFLPIYHGGQGKRCLPHACGGVSLESVCIKSLCASSPRLWGCF